MPSLLIYSDSHCGGDVIVRKVAERLDYRIIGDEVFREAAARYPATEEQLTRAIVEPPSLFGMGPKRRLRRLAYLTATLASFVLEDGVIYDRPGGHLLLQGIPHLIRISITGDADQRAARMSKAQDISAEKAAKAVAIEERDRDRCVELIFEIDPEESTLFDLVLDVDRDGEDAAVDAIVEAAGSRRFQTTTYSRRCLQNAALSAQVRAALVHRDPHVQVYADSGDVSVRIHVSERARVGALAEIHAELDALPDLRHLELEPVIVPPGGDPYKM